MKRCIPGWFGRAGSAAATLALAGCVGTASTRPVADTGARVEAGSDAAYRRALAAMVAADGPTAIARLRALPPQGLSAQQRALSDCIVARFDGGVAAPDPVAPTPAAAGVLLAYRDYWRAMLMHRVDADAAERALHGALERHSGMPAPTLQAQSQQALALLEAQGLHALGGTTPPLRELMVWRRQASHRTTVSLPDETIDVDVTLLDDFISLGWLGYATCDRHHTGGWATPQGLMVVAPAWNLQDEPYRVSLLAHEAQHYADYRRYPRLGPADLEYRAKLVELTLAHRTQRDLMASFVAQAAPDPASPHAYASHWVATRLRERLAPGDLSSADPARLREAAHALLQAHTQALQSRGAAVVETALP